MSKSTQSSEDLYDKVDKLDEKVMAIAHGLSALASTVMTSDERVSTNEEVKRLRKVNAALLNIIKELVADE